MDDIELTAPEVCPGSLLVLGVQFGLPKSDRLTVADTVLPVSVRFAHDSKSFEDDHWSHIHLFSLDNLANHERWGGFTNFCPLERNQNWLNDGK